MSLSKSLTVIDAIAFTVFLRRAGFELAPEKRS